MWTRADNGSELNWNEATNYCRNLQLAGHSDWRLPRINELQAIYDLKADVHGYNVKGNLQLSGWEWSNSQDEPTGGLWSFGQSDVDRAAGALRASSRALCVRGS
jgi:hypothetical protein